jgi:hypothetical protein
MPRVLAVFSIQQTALLIFYNPNPNPIPNQVSVPKHLLDGK